MSIIHPLRGCPVRLRLALWNVGVLALVLAAFGAAIRYTDQVTLTTGLDRALARRADGLLMAEFDMRHGGPPAPEFGPPGGGGQIDGPGRHGLPPGEFVYRGGEHFHRGDGHKPHPGRGGIGPWGPGEYRPEGRGAREWGPPGGPPPPPLQIEYRFLNLAGQPFKAADRSGAMRAAGLWDPAAFAGAARGQEVASTITASGQPMRVLSIPLRQQGKPVGVLQLATPLVGVYAELDRLSGTLLTLFPLALLAAALGGAFLTEHALRPVRQITQAAAQIEASDLAERLPVIGKDEFSELAATFNGMLGRLERAFTQIALALEQQRRFTSDASHELRTPLTIIKANTSLALEEERSNAEYRRALEAADRATDTTTRIVQDLLLLARGDAGQLRLERCPVQMSRLLKQAAEPFRGSAAAPIAIQLSDPSLTLPGDSHHLLRLFTNLLENAVRHTPPTGHITVTAGAEEDGVIVWVRDTGEGIPPEHLPHVCERFYRVDAARTRRHGGTGLGLAICQSIVEAHDGALAIESVVGKGTIVTVRLPGVVSPTGEGPASPGAQISGSVDRTHPRISHPHASRAS